MSDTTRGKAASTAVPGSAVQVQESAEMTPAERLRNAAYLLRKGSPLPADLPPLRQVLAAVMDQEATWAEDRGDRYPATAPVLLLADAVRTEVSAYEGDL